MRCFRIMLAIVHLLLEMFTAYSVIIQSFTDQIRPSYGLQPCLCPASENILAYMYIAFTLFINSFRGSGPKVRTCGSGQVW